MNPPSVKIGQRIRLIRMDDDPDPIPVGTTGEVLEVIEAMVLQAGVSGQRREWYIQMKWDNGRTLNLIYPKDEFEVIG